MPTMPGYSQQFFNSQFPSGQPHSSRGRLPVGELGPDSWAVLPHQPDANGQYNRCPVGKVGAARRMDHVGTRHPARALSSKPCKGVFDDATDPGLIGKVCH